MKIKDTLDLCGWGLHNFCIQNHDDLETLQNLGLGRKIFYTGNSNDKHHREVIYDGSTWRVSAYMSDVEGVQSNLSALTERVNAFLDGDVNSNEVLDNLKEIQAFLDAYPEATSLVQILDTKANAGIESGKGYVALPYANNKQAFIFYNGGFEWSLTNEGWTGSHKILHQGNFANLIGDTYLKTTGGTITGEQTTILTLTGAKDNQYALLYYKTGDTFRGNVGWGHDRGMSLYNVASNATLGIKDDGTPHYNNNTLLHSGNFADYAVKYDNGASIDAARHSIGYDNGSHGSVKLPTATGGGYISFGHDSYGGQLLGQSNGLALYYRGVQNNVLSNWKTIAFTDSDISGNAATATKLETPRTIWGQSFDGTGDVGGTLSGVNNIYMNEGYRFYIGGVDSLYLYPSQKTIYIGYGAGTTYATAIAGNEVSLRYGGLNTGFILNSSGNVGIGVDSPTERLDVDGAIKATNATIANYIYALAYRTAGESGVWKGSAFTSSLGDTDLVIKGDTVKVVGDLYVEGNIIATKEVSAGGAGTEGNGGAGGFSLYESWGTSAPTEPLALGANLGYELKTRVEDLELAKTKVEISDTLVSGKPIGAITIDGDKTNLFAPATYAWSEITGTENVLLKSGGTINGRLTISRNVEGDATPLEIQTADVMSTLRFRTNGSLVYFGYNQSKGLFVTNNGGWSNEYRILHEGNYTEYALPLTGGTISGTLEIKSILTAQGRVKTYGLMEFNHRDDGTVMIANDKHAGLGEGKQLALYTNSRWYTMLHSGNVGDYALKTDGSNAMTGGVNWNDVSVGTNVDTFGEGLIVGKTTDGGTTLDGLGYKYASVLNVSDGAYRFQIASAATNANKLLYRGYDANAKSYFDWKTIAFADGSNASGTWDITSQRSLLLYQPKDGAQVEDVMTGQVLRGLRFIHTVPRDIEGMFPATNYANAMLVINRHSGGGSSQLGFSGNGNIYYRLMSDTDWKTIAFTDSDITGNAATATVAESAKTLLSAENFKLFYTYPNINTWSLGYPTYYANLDFETLSFRCGSGYNTAMFINSSGNVTIGVGDLAGMGCKFFVSGSQFLACSDDASVALNGLPTNGFAMGYKGSRGLYMWLSGAGAASIQVKRFDTQSEAYALNLNPLGGAVNIASANANTNVLGHLYASKDLYMSGFLMMNHGKEGIYIAGASLNWHNTNNAWSASLLSFAKDSFTIHPSLYVNGLANFSSRVLIGGAVDDGASHLQIKGTTRVHATTNWETESIKISSYGIQYYGRKDGGYVQGLMFYSYDGVGLCELGYNSDTFFIGHRYNNPWLSIKDSVLNVHIPTQLSSSLEVNDTSAFGGQSTFNALALFNEKIVAKNTLQIGDANIWWDEEKKALFVDKSLASMGEVSAGGAGTEGGNTGGGGSTGTITNPYVVTFTPSQETSHTFYHNLPYYDVVVQVYEKNAISGAWDMILADVTIANESNLVTVNFGRKENVEHKIVVR